MSAAEEGCKPVSNFVKVEEWYHNISQGRTQWSSSWSLGMGDLVWSPPTTVLEISRAEFRAMFLSRQASHLTACQAFVCFLSAEICPSYPVLSRQSQRMLLKFVQDPHQF